MKKARIVSRRGSRTPEGWERIDEIRMGRKGTGRVVFSVVVWPWSGKSEDVADEWIRREAARQNLDVSYF